jgi:hypothetical protein
VPGIRATVRLARHLLEMYRRQIQDERARKQLHRLDRRLLRVVFGTRSPPRGRKVREHWAGQQAEGYQDMRHFG